MPLTSVSGAVSCPRFSEPPGRDPTTFPFYKRGDAGSERRVPRRRSQYGEDMLRQSIPNLKFRFALSRLWAKKQVTDTWMLKSRRRKKPHGSQPD